MSVLFLLSAAPLRYPLESVVLRAPEDGDHQPRASDHDQRGHNPPLGVGARTQRGLQAPGRGVDHRLQEHVRMPQVESAPDSVLHRIVSV